MCAKAAMIHAKAAVICAKAATTCAKVASIYAKDASICANDATIHTKDANMSAIMCDLKLETAFLMRAQTCTSVINLKLELQDMQAEY